MTCSAPNQPPTRPRVQAAAGSDRPAPGKSVPLTVISEKKVVIKASKSGPRRAAALILVHVLMAVHVAWWLLRGDVLTPVEPSESMQTLEQGVVNAGFVFFVSAMALQWVFGRFMCGWACHLVAVQDLCGWILGKFGVRPHPFRSRLLMWAPLVLALYMFVWPTAKRALIFPFVEPRWPALAELMGRPAPFPAQGFIFRFATTDFWATFGSIAVAVPFLLVCGGLCVYFLGAKGFCTYGCPYGGFFTPIDRLSPGRIIVDHAKCESCGHCTAVCTSNVRVHEEIKLHGMVVNPGCMKCLDCVSVCPNDALQWGLTLPPVLKNHPAPASSLRTAAPPRRRYDLTWPQELALTVVFLGAFWSLRGAYELIPILFAMGLAGCVTFLCWKLWQLLAVRDTRVLGLQLKRQGKLRGAGVTFAGAMILLLVLIAHTGVVNYFRVRGDRIFERIAVPKEALLTPGAPPPPETAVADARRALAYYERAAPWWRGGIALGNNLFIEKNAAQLYLMAGDPGSCEAALRRLQASAGEQDELTNDIARVMRLRGNGAEADKLVADALQRRPEFWSVRERRAGEWIGSGRARETLDDALAALKVIPTGWETRAARARTRVIAGWALSSLGRPDEALVQFEESVKEAPSYAPARAALARALLQFKGDAPKAAEHLRKAAELDPGAPEHLFTLAQIELGTGNAKDAIKLFERALKVSRGDPRLRDAVRQMLAQPGLENEAKAWEAAHPAGKN